MIAVMSADGFIARQSSEVSTAWTSAEDKKRLTRLTKRARAVVMGRKTFETFGSRPLKDRDLFIYSRQAGQGALDEMPTAGDASSGRVSWTQLPPRELVLALAQRGYAELAVCGGAEVYSQFLAAGLVDELYLTIEPVLFGAGVSLASQASEWRLELLAHELTPGGTTFIDYRLIKASPAPG